MEKIEDMLAFPDPGQSRGHNASTGQAVRSQAAGETPKISNPMPLLVPGGERAKTPACLVVSRSRYNWLRSRVRGCGGTLGQRELRCDLGPAQMPLEDFLALTERRECAALHNGNLVRGREDTHSVRDDDHRDVGDLHLLDCIH